jgi:hypothetical protein
MKWRKNKIKKMRRHVKEKEEMHTWPKGRCEQNK